MHTINSVQWPSIRAQMEAAGLILAPDTDRPIVVGRMIEGTAHDSIPALELVAVDRDGQPVLHTVARRSPGEWVPFDGVSFQTSGKG